MNLFKLSSDRPRIILGALIVLFSLSACSPGEIGDDIALTARANDAKATSTTETSTRLETPTPTPTPTLTLTLTQSLTSTPTSLSTPTMSATETEVGDKNYCLTRQSPTLPCFWKVLLGDSDKDIAGDTFFSIALEAYEDYDYALLIMNFNRDDFGYQARLGTSNGQKDFLFLPRAEVSSQPREPFFPETYPVCNEFDLEQEKPCIYRAFEGDSFREIAQRFYSYNAMAEPCIRQANFVISSTSNKFELLLEKNGLAGFFLLLPVLSDVYC